MVEEFYRVVVTLIPDGLMATLMGLAVLTTFLRYRKRRNWAIWGVILALAAFTLFYIWGTAFGPPSLARLAAGRSVSFGIAVSINIWNIVTLWGKDG